MKYDIIVVGGGFAGVAAAVSAAREDAKVLSVSYTHLTLPTILLV